MRQQGNRRTEGPSRAASYAAKVLTSRAPGFEEDRLFQALLRYSAEEWGSFVACLKGGYTHEQPPFATLR